MFNFLLLESVYFYSLSFKVLHQTRGRVLHYGFQTPRNRSTHVRESGFRNPRNFCSYNPESWALESIIQLKESGIPIKVAIQNQRSTDKYWNPMPRIRNLGNLLVESGIIDFGTRNTTQEIRNPTNDCNP